MPARLTVSTRPLTATTSWGRSSYARLCLLLVVGSCAATLLAQPAPGGGAETSLERLAPAVHARLVGQERAQGALFRALANRTSAVDERALLGRLTQTLSASAIAPTADAEADRGLDVLGAAGAALIRRTYAFEREVIAIHARVPPADRREALDAAVRAYQRAGRAVADAAKDMSILYDHRYTSFVAPVPPEAEPRRNLRYPRLTGAMWAARWYSLAVLEAFDAAPGPERDAAQAIVADRLRAKLTFGTPPDGVPGELPLAPAIAPGLVATHDGTAAILDNLHMMLDVLADVLVHPAASNRRAAIDTVVAQFTTRDYRCVQVDEWIVVALRHSIFAQGGPALATMSARERNSFSGVHGQHYGPRRLPPPCAPAAAP